MKRVATDWIDRVVETGRKGLKTGAGIYDYDEGSRTPKPSEEVMAIIREESEKLGIERVAKSTDDIVERGMLALINEGAKILGEGIAIRASDIDIVYLNGYGFPAYRGGPMHYADQMGVKAVYKKICAYKEQFGPRWWEPAPLLKELAEADMSFARL